MTVLSFLMRVMPRSLKALLQTAVNALAGGFIGSFLDILVSDTGK
jgi:hypothetical protein